MPRPRKYRRIKGEFDVFYYKPQGVRMRNLEEVNLEIDELEAIRLVDLENMNMDEAAKKMCISKPTLCRVVNSGRQKVAEAICTGKAISIYNLTNKTMPNFDGTGPDGEGPNTGRGMGNCKGAKKSGEARPRRNAANRRGAGRGRGMGRGRR